MQARIPAGESSTPRTEAGTGTDNKFLGPGTCTTSPFSYCAGMIMLDRDQLDLVCVWPSATRSGASCARLRPNSTLRAAGRPAACAVHSRAMRGRARRRGPGAGEDDGHQVAVRQGNVAALALHPELTGDIRLYTLPLGLGLVGVLAASDPVLDERRTLSPGRTKWAKRDRRSGAGSCVR
jgi:hypothetical protein